MEWWKIFGVKIDDINFICAELLNLYETPILRAQDVERVLGLLNQKEKEEKEIEIQKLKEEGKYEKKTKWNTVKQQD